MAQRVRIVGLGGSLAAPSSSLAALRIAMAAVAEAGAEATVLDVRALDLPMYQPRAARVPDAVVRLCDAVRGADGMVWSSPLYHGTISGSFKNALDWLELLGDGARPYLTDKVVGLISTAAGVQGLQAVNTMEFVVRALRGWAVPLVMPIARAGHAFDDEGRALDPRVEEQLRTLGREVVRAARQFSGQAVTPPEAVRAEAAVEPHGADALPKR